MKPDQLSDDITRLGWALRRVVSLVYQDSSAMRKKHGVTGPQSLAMKCLHESSDPLSSAALSRELGVTPANVTGLIDRLAQKNLVERVQGNGDRRKVFLRLTGAGARMAGGLCSPMEDKLRSGPDALPPREMTRILHALDTLLDFLSVEEAPAGAAGKPTRLPEAAP